jgi:aerobic-type carbon monoxide dehydrogenase small subunit (CoxS/CutS family)
VEAPPERSLLSVLREDLDLTGAKYGCGEGQCGACTVLLDSRPVMACITPVAAAAGKAVETVEGLAQGEAEGAVEVRLHPLQQAFIDCTAMQCGFCTPGMLMAAAGLLRLQPQPSQDQIVRAMQANVCRCGVYQRIVQAIQLAAREMSR